MKKTLLLLTLFANIACDKVDSSSSENLAEEKCRLSLTVKEEWSLNPNNAFIRFLVSVENIGDLPIGKIHVTVNLYFKNNDILKTRFSINDLKIMPGQIAEEYGIIFDSNSDKFFTGIMSQNDIDRIIYDAPYYTCIN